MSLHPGTYQAYCNNKDCRIIGYQLIVYGDEEETVEQVTCHMCQQKMRLEVKDLWTNNKK